MGTNITGIGNANAIGFKSRVTGGAYLPPELKDALVGVWSAYGKSNDSTDRNIIKNKIKDRGGDFVISNAAFKLNSGFGGFVEDFTSWDRIDSSTAEISNDGSKIKCINTTLNVQYLFNYINRDISSFKVKISNFTKGDITYYYRKEDGIEAFFKITPLSVVNSDKVIELPKSYNTVENGTGSRGGFYSSNINIGVTITQIPSFEGAFVTDGINDLITSTKTVQEMGITDEVTVVSMIHQIDLNSTYTIATTNYIENSNSKEHVRSDVYNYGKTGIYGYSASLINNTKSDIKNILGDEADYYVKSTNSLQTIFDAKFSVVGRISELIEASQVAWYWTIIANKVLTTDQINQVIAYYNLDKYVKPDILCDVKKQGITNENHAEFGDKLIDFSGNGRDIQLNNLAWKGDSGIGKYNFSNINIIASNGFEGAVTTNKCHFTKKLTNTTNNFCDLIVISPNEPIKFKVSGLSDGRKLFVANKSGSGSNYNFDNGEHEVSLSFSEGVGQNNPFGVTGGIGDIDVTVEFIPSHAGALCLDGVNDFGKVTGMPVYKDYTVVTDREIFANIGAISSKNNPGAFVETAGNSVYSFGQATSGLNFISTRSISYLSKYSYCGQSITAGAAEDGTDMWLGTIRDNDSRFFNGAIYSLMSFPYSMSKFLIERQLKKHKLGTLYPNMVEFRPVIKSSVELASKPTFVTRGTSTLLNTGDYIPENSEIWVVITMNNAADRITKFVINGNTIDIPSSAYNPSTMKYGFPFTIDSKSPQKITMTIEQDENYVKFEPVITSNVEYNNLDFYLNNYQKRINIGDYIPKDAYLRADFYLKNNVDELTVFTFNGVNIGYRRSSVDDTAFNIGQIYNYDSPQEVNITIDEYIRYEDIVQPYPVLLRFKDENGNEVSWGGKFRVGSTITRIGSAADSNLLPNIYNIFGLLLNDNQVTSSKVIVEKTMVFKAKSAYIFDNNEPKVILSPRLLRIPNSSYKILGYIPDISGHGNHGVIHNSVYAKGSGVNEDGSYQFDGVDDFVTIPTVTGGKQVLMKVNWQSDVGAATLYDQRLNISDYEFAIYNGTRDLDDNPVIAYQGRNNGQTYIDGILNSNIMASELKAITHNITITNELSLGINNTYPVIGSVRSNSHFTQMSLYDFMLFDEISTDDKIKELNEYVGIEGNTE